MKIIHTVLIAGLPLLGAGLGGMHLLLRDEVPIPEEQKTARLALAKQQAIKEKIHVIVLQRFIVAGGSYDVHLEVKGAKALGVVCDNLRRMQYIVGKAHFQDKPDPARYSEIFLRDINALFDRPYVRQVLVSSIGAGGADPGLKSRVNVIKSRSGVCLLPKKKSRKKTPTFKPPSPFK